MIQNISIICRLFYIADSLFVTYQFNSWVTSHNGDRKHRPIATKRSFFILLEKQDFNFNFFIRTSTVYQGNIRLRRSSRVTEMQRGRIEWALDTIEGLILKRHLKVVRVNSNVWLKRRARDECQGEARRRPKRPRMSLTWRGRRGWGGVGPREYVRYDWTSTDVLTSWYLWQTWLLLLFTLMWFFVC